MFEGIERIFLSKDWITVLLVVVFCLLVILKIAHNERFTKLFSILYSEKYYTDYMKTKPVLFNQFHFLFIIIITINISLFGFNIINSFFFNDLEADLFLFLQITFLTITYLIIRYISGYILSILFEVSDVQEHITFLKISNLALISVLLLPLLLFINYSVGSLHQFIVIFSLVVVMVLSLLSYYIIMKKERLNFNSLLYIILYLCALEIAPFVVIYKTIVA